MILLFPDLELTFVFFQPDFNKEFLFILTDKKDCFKIYWSSTRSMKPNNFFSKWNFDSRLYFPKNTSILFLVNIILHWGFWVISEARFTFLTVMLSISTFQYGIAIFVNNDYLTCFFFKLMLILHIAWKKFSIAKTWFVALKLTITYVTGSFLDQNII